MWDIMIGEKDVSCSWSNSWSERRICSRSLYPDLRMWVCEMSTEKLANELTTSRNTFLTMMIGLMDTTPHESTFGMSSSLSSLHGLNWRWSDTSSGMVVSARTECKLESEFDQTSMTRYKISIVVVVSLIDLRFKRLSSEDVVWGIWV